MSAAEAAAPGIRPGSVRAWVLACRPATLTAAVVPVLVGLAVAYPTARARRQAMPELPALAALLGAILLQILTNLVNDVADHEKGADTAERLGPTRAAQSGLLTPRQMWTGVAVCVAAALGLGVYLTAVAGWPIVAIGVASILAGVSYTAGPWPLGYHGLGDVFVFVFFGLVAVCGTGFVELGVVPALAWFAAVPVGSIATAVLVVNNVRDRATDAVAGKRTLAVRLGRRAGVAEYAALLLAAYVTPVVVMVLFERSAWVLLPLISLPVAVLLLRTLATREGRALNACLTGTAKLLLLHGGLFAIGLLVSWELMRLVDSALEAVEAGGRRSVLLRLVDEDGSSGRGEASPLPGFSPDTAAACAAALGRIHLRLGELPDGLPPAAAAALGLAPVEGELAGVPAARFALETALFDLIGRRRNLSLAECLGGPRPYGSVPVNGLLIARGGESLVERGLRLVEEGVTVLKVKLRARDDAGFALELGALGGLRAALPAGFELRLDANGAWGVGEARERLAALLPLAPRFVEQPVAAPDLLALGPCALPWAADESLLIPGMAERLLGAEGCVAFVLKPALLGGLLRSVTLGARAQARGLDVVVTHLFDGPVALAAAVELALALPRPPLACGLHPHDAPGGWPEEPVPQLARAGVARASNAPGLGMEEPAARIWRVRPRPEGP